MDVYTTFPLESREMAWVREHLFPVLALVVEVRGPEAIHPVYIGNLVDTLRHIHGAAAASTEEYLCVILTDISGDQETLRGLFSSMPPALGMQLITFDVTGAKNLAIYQHLRSSQLIFSATAWDEEAEQVLNQIRDGWNQA